MKNILVCIDFSDVTVAVADVTIKMARALGAQVHLLHVAAPEPTFVSYETGPQAEREWRAQRLRYEHRELQELAKRFDDQGLKAVPLLVAGPTVEKIIEQIEKLEADMLVIGSHGHGAVYELLVGSVTEGVLKKSRCPVLVVPSPR